MQSLSQIEKKLEELPILPAVIVRLLALNTDDDEYFDQVFELSQEDPSFALRIIKLSNSVASSPTNSITNLRDAVVRLGVKTVAGLVTSMAAMRVFLPNTAGEKNLWVHSIQVAVGARYIAQVDSSLKIDSEQAYLCGLLHDIGRFVIFDKAVDDLNLVEDEHWESPTQLVDLENKLYGFNHAELGQRVCKKWEVPEIVTEVVGKHHMYELPSDPPRDPELDKLIRIVQMADFFSVFIMLNPDAIFWEPEVLEEKLAEKCVHPSSSSPPISVKELQSQAGNIIEQSLKMTVGLGVRTVS